MKGFIVSSNEWNSPIHSVAVGMLFLIGNYPVIAKALNPAYNSDMETMYMFIWRYASCPLSISLVVLDAFLCTELRRRGLGRALRNFLEFVGMYSMEYYMIYLNINGWLDRVFDIRKDHYLILYFGSFFFSLGLCVVVRKLCDFFMAYISRVPKAPQTLADNAPYSVKWYDFLICVGLFGLAAFRIFIGVYYFTEGQVALGVCSMIVALAAIMTRFLLSSRKAAGVVMLYGVFVLNTVSILLNRAILHKLLRHLAEIGKTAWLSTAALIALTVAAIILNKKYFDKRKELLTKSA